MTKIKHNISNKKRRQQRVHARVQATAKRPKLLLIRSNRFLTGQVIDEQGQVLATVSEGVLRKNGQIKSGLTKTEGAAIVGQELAQALKAKKIKAVAVDRGPYKFHGRIKQAVTVIRDSGIEV